MVVRYWTCSGPDLSFTSTRRCGGALLKSLNRFAAYSSDPTERKLGKIIPDTSPPIVQSWIFRFHSKGHCGGAPLKSSNQFTAYSIHAVELKLCRVILKMSACAIVMSRIFWVHEEKDFRIFSGVNCTCSLVSPSQKSLFLDSGDDRSVRSALSY